MLMPPIKRKWKQRKITLLIPGGWDAIVPQILEDEPHVMSKAWAQYLNDAKVVHNQFDGQKLATVMHQNVYNYAWRVLLSQSIFYWAKEYAKRYPESLDLVPKGHYSDASGECVIAGDTFLLRGFNPAIMQHAFVPNQKPGLDGLKFVDSMMREMHDE